jgi:hypothetical protein
MRCSPAPDSVAWVFTGKHEQLSVDYIIAHVKPESVGYLTKYSYKLTAVQQGVGMSRTASRHSCMSSGKQGMWKNVHIRATVRD